MTQIYCNECHEAITMHADLSFACECEGPLQLKDGGDPLPDSWRGHQMGAHETEIVLRRMADEERHYSEEAA